MSLLSEWFSRRLGRGDRYQKTVMRSPATSGEIGVVPLMSSTVLRWEIGDVILGVYEIRAIHEGGGMGLVYRVFHRQWGVELAVKRPRQDYFWTDAQKRAFIRECETWMGIGLHENIVTCHYVRSIEDVPCIFAEYVEGGSLSEWISSGSLYVGGHNQALQRILDVAIQMAWGLHFAHEHGIVHQDVKPSNVLLTTGGIAKITDFGIARARALAAGEQAERGNTDLRISVSSGGMTPAYSSPEQASGRSVSTKTDIWSWGVSVMEMFAGGVTWLSGQAAKEVLKGLSKCAHGGSQVPIMPQAVADLLETCFMSKPERRPENLLRVADRLKAVFEDITGGEYPRPGPFSAAAVPDTLNNTALSLLDLGKRDDALQRWRAALAMDSYHAESTYNHSVVLWRCGQFTDEDVLLRIQLMIDRLPGSWLNHYVFALAEMERGNNAGALNALEAAQQLAPAEPIISQTLADLARRTDTSGHLAGTFAGHSSQITASCISRDGRYLLSGSTDKTARLWDIATGACLRVFSGHTDPLRAVALTETADLAVTASGGDDTWRTDDNSVRLWDTTSGGCVRLLQGHTEPVRTVCISPDRKVVLSGSFDGTLRVWNLETEHCIQLFGHTSWINGACLSPDARLAVSISNDKTLRFWDTTSGSCLRTIELQTEEPSALCLSADGSTLIVCGDSGTLMLFDMADGRTLPTLKIRGGGEALYVNARRTLAFVGGFTTTRIWHLESGRCLASYPTGSVLSASFAEKNGRLYVAARGEDNEVSVWELPYLESLSESPLVLSRVRQTAEISDTERKFQRILSRAKDAEVTGNVANAGVLLDEARALPGFQRSIAVRAARARLGLRGRRLGLRSIYPVMKFEGLSDVTRAVCFSSDASLAVSVGWDAVLRVWDVETGRCRRTIRNENSEAERNIIHGFESLALSSNNRWCLTGKFLGMIELWDLSAGTRVRVFEGHTRPVTGLCLTTDSRFAVSGSSDRTVRVWDVGTGASIRTEAFDREVSYVCLSEDDQFMLLSSGGARLVEVSTGKQWRYFSGERAILTSNAKLVVSLEADGLGIWDVATASRLRTIPVSFRSKRLSESAVISVSRDARFVVVAQSEGEHLEIWNIETGDRVGTAEGSSPVFLSADARLLLCGGRGRCRDLLLWELEWDWEFPPSTLWDEGARPYLEFFLERHRPCDRGFAGPGPVRSGVPRWNSEDFASLLRDLAVRGYGWLRPEGISQKLDEMKRNI